MKFLIGLTLIHVFVIISCFFECSADFRRNKPYINEFFFKLTDDSNLDIVKKRAETLKFHWLRKVIPRLHLFSNHDIPVNTEKPVPDHVIDRWLNAFGNLVEYIEQEKYTPVYPIVEEAEPAAHNGIPEDEPGYSRAQHPHPHYRSTDQTEKTLEITTLLSTPKQRTLVKKVRKTGALTKPIKIAVLDAFFDTEHHNLQNSIMKGEGYNFVDGNTNPQPDEFPDDFFEEHYPELYHIYSHGTMCMGRIASSAEFGCNQALRFIDEAGVRRDENEIAALAYRNNEIDIYSCSYGARDNVGFSSSKLAPIEDALAEGVSKGHQCKGSIYLFPSGNGNGNGRLDNCNSDVYSTSVNTITIASITMSNKISEEAEVCPCALVASFGSPDPLLKLYMNTTKPKNKCTFHFRGSSAATAYAAGMISHALRENPQLSKRDIEHLLVRTANIDLDSSVDWKHNGANFKFNEKIGFGAIDLKALKDAAKRWKHVPEKHVCVVDKKGGIGGFATGKMYTTEYKIASNGCHDSQSHVRHLEHVQLEVVLSCSNISNIVINLVSPMKTRVGLLTKISLVKYGKTVYHKLKWTFMAVQFWGEDPVGEWMVELIAKGIDVVTSEIQIKKLILHGTEKHPLAGGSPRNCEPDTDNASETKSRFPLGVVITPIMITVITVGLILLLYFLCWKENTSVRSVALSRYFLCWRKQENLPQGTLSLSQLMNQRKSLLPDDRQSDFEENSVVTEQDNVLMV